MKRMKAEGEGSKEEREKGLEGGSVAMVDWV